MFIIILTRITPVTFHIKLKRKFSPAIAYAGNRSIASNILFVAGLTPLAAAGNNYSITINNPGKQKDFLKSVSSVTNFFYDRLIGPGEEIYMHIE